LFLFVIGQTRTICQTISSHPHLFWLPTDLLIKSGTFILCFTKKTMLFHFTWSILQHLVFVGRACTMPRKEEIVKSWFSHPPKSSSCSLWLCISTLFVNIIVIFFFECFIIQFLWVLNIDYIYFLVVVT
jgi:hypothetical protein